MPSTGILMRLMEMKGDEYSIDEVIIPPKFKANWLRFPETKAEHRIMAPGGKLELLKSGGKFDRPVDRRMQGLVPRKPAIVRTGQWHRVINESDHPIGLVLKLSPSWNPKRAHFRLGNREFRGDEVWFEVKTHIFDKATREMYMLHELSADRGFVSVRLGPRASALECYHKTATVVIKGVKGKGQVSVGGELRPIEPGKEVLVKPGQRYQLRNPQDTVLEVTQTHTKQWEPEDTFYVIDERVVPGDQVWFEFVVPD